jgi:hypothetical protein
MNHVNEIPTGHLFVVAEELVALSWIRMPQLRHIASALGVPCSSFRCVVQWPYSVCGGVWVCSGSQEKQVIFTVYKRLISSDIYSVIWLDEREKRLGKDVEGNGTVAVF